MKTKKWEANYPQIAKAIEESGFKISAVAKSVGLTYRQLYGRLTNECEFELPVMRKLSAKLGMSMDTLFNEKNFLI